MHNHVGKCHILFDGFVERAPFPRWLIVYLYVILNVQLFAWFLWSPENRNVVGQCCFALLWHSPEKETIEERVQILTIAGIHRDWVPLLFVLLVKGGPHCFTLPCPSTLSLRMSQYTVLKDVSVHCLRRCPKLLRSSLSSSALTYSWISRPLISRVRCRAAISRLIDSILSAVHR